MTLEQSILEAIRALPPEKQREVLEHANQLRKSSAKKPRKSGRGLWARLSSSAGIALDQANAAGDAILIPSISLVELTYLVEKGRLPAEALAMDHDSFGSS